MIKILKCKTILIISPQPWEGMKVSKHNYAIELLKHNNHVYFLNPTSINLKRGECRLSFISKEGVRVIDYRPIFPMRYKFLFNRLFNLFIIYEIKKILKVIGTNLDVVWDFEPNRQFCNLKHFKSKIRIYHPVDITTNINSSTKNADVIFSVTDVILQLFKQSKVPHFSINHGLSTQFAEKASFLLNLTSIKSDSVIHAGYIGNLRMEGIDRSAFMKIIMNHPHVKFHLWGPYDKDFGLLLCKKQEIDEFIEFLKNTGNVILYGLTSSADILKDIEKVDVFFWCFNSDLDLNRRSNSHKILEYLSTGKALVSFPISNYDSNINEDVIIFPKNGQSFEECFYNVVNNLIFFNDYSLRRKRIQLALENTYERQLQKIDDHLLNIFKEFK